MSDPKVTPQNLKDCGFTPEMFGQRLDTFDQWLTDLIAVSSAYLQTRIGSSYDSVPLVSEVTEVERQYCQKELWDRRITWKLANAKGDAPSCKYELEMRDRAANKTLELLGNVGGNDFASGVLVSGDYATD